MTNNIFVPQTFNGERMVNVSLPNRRNGGSPPADNTTAAGSIGPTLRLTAPPAPEEAPTVVTTTKKIKPKKQQPAATPTTTNNNNNNNKDNSVQKYWSEANIAILIQLNRKYFINIAYDDSQPNINLWTQLTNEYNSITGEERSKEALVNRWAKVMNKYNAERSCLRSQKQKAASGHMPMVSYWNHFQYLDGYLSHLPVPDDSLYMKYSEDCDDVMIPEGSSNKRKFTYENDEHRRKVYAVDDKLRLLESQRVTMEQTLDRQQSQIDMMNKNYKSMNQMNMKFVDICEKITSRSQSNEDRYLKLLEKLMDEKLPEKKQISVNDDTDYRSVRGTPLMPAMSPPSHDF